MMMIPLKKYLLYLIVLAIVIFLILGNFYCWFLISQPSSSQDLKINFVVSTGQGAREIAQALSDKGLIKHKWLFLYYLWQRGKLRNLQAGEYSLNSQMSIAQIADAIVGGDLIDNEVSVTFPEGCTAEEIGQYLERAGIVSKKDFVSFIWAPSGLPESYQQKIKDYGGEIGLEGFLFPDTYNFYKNSSAKEVVIKMLDNFNQKINQQMLNDIKSQQKSLYDILIMASILEKEVISFEDRQMVADIFWRRLDEGMPLQSCATIAYILGQHKWRYSYEETRTESPYNTYIHQGLPPTPINNPGLEAIKAAIYPLKTEYKYFLSKLDGETVFSKTLEEHKRNKQKYLN